MGRAPHGEEASTPPAAGHFWEPLPPRNSLEWLHGGPLLIPEGMTFEGRQLARHLAPEHLPRHQGWREGCWPKGEDRTLQPFPADPDQPAPFSHTLVTFIYLYIIVIY